MLRLFALLAGALAIAASVALIIGLGGLAFAGWLDALAVAFGASAAAWLAFALPGRWWLAPSVSVAFHAAVAIALARIQLMGWPSDLRLASPSTQLRLALALALGLLVCLGLYRLRGTGRRRLVGALGAGLALAGLAAVLLVLGQLREHGLLPFAHGGRVAAFDRLWRNLERTYVRWDPAALPALRDRYRPIVVEADRDCGRFDDCAPYRAAIRDMLAELRDGHTRIASPGDRAIPPHPIEPIDGAAIVTAGPWRGFAVVAVGGRPIDQVLASTPPHAIAYSAPHTRRRQAYAQLLAGPALTPVAVELEAADHRRSHQIWLRTEALTGEPSMRPVRAHRLAPQLGYVSVPDLRAREVVDQFDRGLALLGDLRDLRGLVLDLRGNRGGSSSVGDAIAGRLLPRPADYGSVCFRARHPLRGVEGCFPLEVAPRPPAVGVALAVLLDGDVASSGEQMALALCTTGRARCFGTTTAGDSGFPLPHFLPGFVAMISTGELYARDGARLDGTGVIPHEVIATHRADLVAGRDPVLEAAVRWVTQQAPDAPDAPRNTGSPTGTPPPVPMN